MARARNIKPGFFKNYELADAGAHAQLLFAGLWCLADREGRLEDKPRLIKAEIFPYYDVDVNGGLTVLARLKFVKRYIVDGVAVIQIDNFKKHQNPHNTEKATVLPPPPKEEAANLDVEPLPLNNGSLTVDSRNNNGGNLADSLIHRFTDSLIGVPQAAPATPKKPRTPAKTSLPNDFRISDRVRAWATEKGYSNLDRHLENFISACRAKGYQYVDWDESFMGAIRNNWAKIEVTPRLAAVAGYVDPRWKGAK